MRPLLIAGGLALLAGVGAALWWQQAAPPPEPRPDFSLNDLDGTPRHVGEWDGKLLLINFWATWCTPCLREMPLLAAAQARHGAHGLQVLGPALDQPDAVRAYVDTRPVPYPVLIGEEAVMRLMDAMGDKLGALPFTVVVNREGLIVDRHWGALDEDQIADLVARYL